MEKDQLAKVVADARNSQVEDPKKKKKKKKRKYTGPDMSDLFSSGNPSPEAIARAFVKIP